MPEFINEYVVGQHDSRPWGDWTVLDAGPGYTVKRITVTPGGKLSLQRHEYRVEHWFVVAGRARVTRNAEELNVGLGEGVDFAMGDVHRVANEGAENLVFIEVQRGSILRENDIERLEDVYGRT